MHNNGSGTIVDIDLHKELEVRAAATRRAVLVVGSSKGLSAFGPRPDGSRPAHGDTWPQLRRFSAAAGSRSLDAY